MVGKAEVPTNAYSVAARPGYGELKLAGSRRHRYTEGAST